VSIDGACPDCGHDHEPGLSFELGISDDTLLLFIGGVGFPLSVEQARGFARGFTEAADWWEWKEQLENG
jgi:hypothetical protein